MKARLKRFLFGLLGKDPEAVVVTFLSGEERLARAMADQVRGLVPDRRHIEVSLEDGGYWRIRRRLRRYRIGLAPVLFTGDRRYRRLRRAAWLLAPTRILAYNTRLERHHLRLRTWIASWLFLAGVPLDRIWLRPGWLWHWKKDRTVVPAGHRIFDGRAPVPGQRAIAVLSPYYPWPLAHGGAVRIYHLLREIAREFNVVLYAFAEGGEAPGPVMEFCTKAYLVAKPRYREPRWSTLAPPEVHEYESPEMRRLIAHHGADLLQVEYTHMSGYDGDVLVEHDVTFDLYAQERTRRGGVGAWWDWWRWHRFERSAVARYRRVVVMSENDRSLLAVPQARVVPNGVDLERFEPGVERAGRRLLFIGSFRHFPNLVAYRFLTGQILPLLRDVELTVVAGPDPSADVRPASVRLLGFVADVRPLYVDTNLVLVPTLVSAGTNVKVLEALAMERAVVSTSSGCAGLGLTHDENVWIVDTPSRFAAAIHLLLEDDERRKRIARAGRRLAQKHFDWRSIGARQRGLLRELLDEPVRVRPVQESDLDRIRSIQQASGEASQWTVHDYLGFDTLVAIVGGTPAGFLVARATGPGEREILNVAVDPAFRRQGIARRLLAAEFEHGPHTWFLEVRESNAPARRLYESLGFRDAGRRPDYYENPMETAILMRR